MFYQMITKQRDTWYAEGCPIADVISYIEKTRIPRRILPINLENHSKIFSKHILVEVKLLKTINLITERS